MGPKMNHFEANRKMVLAVMRDVTADCLERSRSERLIIKFGFIVGVASLFCGIMGAVSSCNRKAEIKNRAPITETIHTMRTMRTNYISQPPEEQFSRKGIICEI